MSPIEEEEYLALAQITMDRKFQAYFINEGQTCNPEIVPYPCGELCEGKTDIKLTAKFVKTKSDKCYPAISYKYAKKKCKGTKAAKHAKALQDMRPKAPKLRIEFIKNNE